MIMSVIKVDKLLLSGDFYALSFSLSVLLLIFGVDVSWLFFACWGCWRSTVAAIKVCTQLQIDQLLFDTSEVISNYNGHQNSSDCSAHHPPRTSYSSHLNLSSPTLCRPCVPRHYTPPHYSPEHSPALPYTLLPYTLLPSSTLPLPFPILHSPFRLCKDTPGCKYFTVDTAALMCYLKSEKIRVEKTEYTINLISGDMVWQKLKAITWWSMIFVVFLGEHSPEVQLVKNSLQGYVAFGTFHRNKVQTDGMINDAVLT